MPMRSLDSPSKLQRRRPPSASRAQQIEMEPAHGCTTRHLLLLILQRVVMATDARESRTHETNFHALDAGDPIQEILPKVGGGIAIGSGGVPTLMMTMRARLHADRDRNR